MSDRPYILTIEISESGDTTAKLDYGQLTGGRKDITYRIDWNITRQLVRKQFSAIRRNNIDEARKAGDDLAQHLLPKEVRTIFPQDGEALLLSTNKHAIPWELLWDGDFLGVRFAIGRQLITKDKIRKTGIRLATVRQLVAVDEMRKPESNGEARQKNCLFLTNPTDDLPEARKEAKRLMEYFRNHGIACTLIAGEQITSAEIYSYLRSKFDIVHYSGHIDIDEKEGAYLRLSRKDRFYLRTALTLDDFGHPFVFLNGCGGGPSRGSSARIVRPLIDAGCGPILCASMQITDKGSRLFSEQLIANVLSGMSYGKATMETRKRFSGDPSGGTDWMRFVYYGNPLERMETAVSATPNPTENDTGNIGPIVVESARVETAGENNNKDKKSAYLEQGIAASKSTVNVEKTGRGKKALSGRRILLFLLFAIVLFAISAALFFRFTPDSRKLADSVKNTDQLNQTSPAPAQLLPQTPLEPIADAPLKPEDAPVPAEEPAAPPATPATKPKADAPQSYAAASASDFYGSWKNGTGIVIKISWNELTRSLDGVTFRMNITGAEPVSNSNGATRTNYPSGIRFTGTVVEKGWWIDSPEIGDAHSYTFFLRNGGKSFSQNGLPDNANVYSK